jgi:hypothetical protein
MAEVVFDSPNYARVGRWLAEYGSKELRSMMTKAITEAAKPIVPRLRTSVTAGRTDTKVRASSGRSARADQSLSKSKAYGSATGTKRERMEARALRGAGLRATIAKGVQINNRSSGPRAGVRVIQRTSALPWDQKKLPRHMNRGKWRHPVFGNRDVWVEQTFTPGWFDKPVREHRPAVREAIEAEMAEWLELAAFLMEKAAKQ